MPKVQTNFIRNIKNKKKIKFLEYFSESRLSGILSDRKSRHKLLVSDQNTEPN